MIKLNKYKSVIFDFDGVILDSNNIKKESIREAAFGILSQQKLNEFVTYFTDNNGIPREGKIAKFIVGNDFNEVLKK